MRSSNNTSKFTIKKKKKVVTNSNYYKLIDEKQIDNIVNIKYIICYTIKYGVPAIENNENNDNRIRLSEPNQKGHTIKTRTTSISKRVF